MLDRIAPALIAVVALDAAAQCTKDVDCKGERICVNGGCVFKEDVCAPMPSPPPSEAAATSTANLPPPLPARELGEKNGTAPASTYDRIDQVPDDQKEAWWTQRGRRHLVGFHPLALIATAMLGSAVGLSMVMLEFEWSFPLTRWFSLYGEAGPVLVSAASGSATLFSVGAGVHLHFRGDAPEGGFLAAGGSFIPVSDDSAPTFTVMIGWAFVGKALFVSPSVGLELFPGQPYPVGFSLELPVGVTF